METLIAFLRSLQKITNDESTVIASYFEPKCAKEGEYLFRGGKVCDELFFVVSGVLRIVDTNEKGIEVTHYFVGEKQFCTLLQSFNMGIMAEDSIQACCTASLLSISKKRLLDLYQELPFMAGLINQVHEQRLLEKIRLKNMYSGEDSVKRYQLFLAGQPDIAHRVPLHYVASYLNVTPQSLSRIRRNLR